MERRGGATGYSQISHTGLREDPITRHFLRHKAFERGHYGADSTGEIQVTCVGVNQEALYEEPHIYGGEHKGM
jgi:hypothetical protein